MQVAYEHIRLPPKRPLTLELQEGVLEGIRENDTPPSAHEEQPDRSEVIYQCRNAENMSDLLRKTYAPDNNTNIIDHSTGITKSFFTRTVTGEPEKYLGAFEAYLPVLLGNELKSEEQTILNQVYDAIGGAQATRSQMDCAPQWILEKAVSEENESAWKGAYTEVEESDVLKDKNIIGCHVVYKGGKCGVI